MTIGATPLIPLYRVQPIPDARLQRFGVNNTQLFGKPLVEFTTAETRSSKPAVTRQTPTPLQEALDRNQTSALEPPTLGPAVAPATTGVSSNLLGSGGATKPGALVDLKA